MKKKLVTVAVILAFIFAIVDLSLLFYSSSRETQVLSEKYEIYFIDAVSITCFVLIGIIFLLMIATYVYHLLNKNK